MAAEGAAEDAAADAAEDAVVMEAYRRKDPRRRGDTIAERILPVGGRRGDRYRGRGKETEGKIGRAFRYRMRFCARLRVLSLAEMSAGRGNVG